MKNTLLLLIIFICGNTAFAQSTLTETDKLAATAKVWGFLKYYHPKVANGSFNWDKELFKIIPKVEKCENKEQLSKTLQDWINTLGKIKTCKKCAIENDNEYFDKNFDLSWIDNDKVFAPAISDQLRYIEANRHQGKKHYVSIKYKRVGNIEVTNEKKYNSADWTNKDIRLLALFRYWNLVEYFFPYKYQTDTDWSEVLHQMIPKFLNAETEMAYHLAILELIINVDDSHAGFSSELTDAFFGNYWIPASFKLIDDKAVITRFYNDSLANIDDLKTGDAITKVNGKTVSAIFAEKEKYITGSNLSIKKYLAFKAIFNGSSDSVKIEYLRKGKTFEKYIKRYLFDDLNFKRGKAPDNHKILDGNIGYVHMGVLKRADVSSVMDSLKDTKAIIFDIRNYPKGTMYSVLNYISSKKIEFYKVTKPDLNYPGKFIWRNGSAAGLDGELKYKGKIVLLVDERSQSHAEFTIMCLQQGDNVTTIGSQTSGADGNVSKIGFLGGYKTSITGIGIFYPDNTETQRLGVRVDIEIRPTIQGIIDRKDEVLEKAIEFINK